MSDYIPPFNVNVHLLTFNLVQREQEIKSIVTPLKLIGMDHCILWAVVPFINIWSPPKVISKHLLKFRRLPMLFLPPRNANIRAFENASIRSVSFLCNRSKIYTV